ncbi:hypothetical protein, partial [Klebsiella pneumoniae]|uniref:hypothetical protein n=1 Tax=Klebsiella pneumoniae TaxID=573 RepID=UPI002731BADD
DSHWFLAYEYDAQNRLTAEHQGWGTLRYGYDLLGGDSASAKANLLECRLLMEKRVTGLSMTIEVEHT